MARIGLIGLGALGLPTARALAASGRLCAAMARGARPVPGLGEAVATIEALLAAGPDSVVECAGQDALEKLGPAVLSAGRDLLAVSIGALARPGCAASLARAAERSGAALVVASGAVAGLDGLAAARGIGLDRVTYRQYAPPSSWRGHPLAGALPQDGPPQLLFSGSARAAATVFPKNANVTAAIAIAGAGFDRTEVELFCDPAATRTRHAIAARGAFGTLEVAIAAEPVAPGARSSGLVVGSLLAAIEGGGLRLPAARLARIAGEIDA